MKVELEQRDGDIEGTEGLPRSGLGDATHKCWEAGWLGRKNNVHELCRKWKSQTP